MAYYSNKIEKYYTKLFYEPYIICSLHKHNTTTKFFVLSATLSTTL